MKLIKQLFIFGIVFILLALSVIAIPQNGLTYFNLANETDLWGSSSVTFNSGTIINDFPVLNNSDASPNSLHIENLEKLLITNPINFNNDYSISFWVKFDNSGDRHFLYFKNPTNNKKMEFLIAGGKIKFKHEGVTNAEIESQLNNYDSISGWNNFILTFDSFNNLGNIYFNGDVISYSKQTLGHELYDIPLNSSVIVGNKNDFKKPLDGEIDLLKIYQSELTPTQVLNIYEQGEISISVDNNDIINNEEINNFTTCPSDDRDWKNAYILLSILFSLGIIGMIIKNIILEIISGVFLVLFSVVWFHCWVFFAYIVLIIGIIYILTGMTQKF